MQIVWRKVHQLLLRILILACMQDVPWHIITTSYASNSSAIIATTTRQTEDFLQVMFCLLKLDISYTYPLKDRAQCYANEWIFLPYPTNFLHSNFAQWPFMYYSNTCYKVCHMHGLCMCNSNGRLCIIHSKLHDCTFIFNIAYYSCYLDLCTFAKHLHAHIDS